MQALTTRLIDHVSGCSYEMAAMWVKGSRYIVGKNRLTSPAHLKHPHYPKIHGRHCETHVVLLAPERLRGGTLYITGVRSSRNRNQMLTTKPCKHCMKVILTDTDIRTLVYWHEGEMVKELL